MKITSQAIHDLSAAATRLAAIANLVREEETRVELDPAATTRDALAALEKFRLLWTNEILPGLGHKPAPASLTKEENDAP